MVGIGHIQNWWKVHTAGLRVAFVRKTDNFLTMIRKNVESNESSVVETVMGLSVSVIGLIKSSFPMY